MFQSCGFVGRVGRPVSMRYTPDGTAVADFSLAVDVGYGERKQTLWLKVVCWGKLAETVNQYVEKGRVVAVSGELQPAEMYTGRDGQARISQQITAREVKFLTPRGEQASGADVPDGDGVEDLPF